MVYTKSSAFDRRITVRLFDEEFDKLKKITENAKTDNRWQKYDNISHTVRCAIIKFIRDEYNKLPEKEDGT